VRDKQFLAFVASKFCLVCGSPSTVHHVRFCGSHRNDRRTLPLCGRHHQIQPGPYTSIEALGKVKFEATYGVCIEDEIRKLNAEYEEGRAVQLQ
jgi:hypothetical protein